MEYTEAIKFGGSAREEGTMGRQTLEREDEEGLVVEGLRIRWGLLADYEEILALLRLNGMPSRLAFEERFIVAEKGGKVLAAARYRTEAKKLELGLFVADPWAGERELAVALYAEAGELADEIGAKEVVARVGIPDYLAEAGYRRRRGLGWRLDPARPATRHEQHPAGGWRRVAALFDGAAVPFFGPSER